MPYEVLTDPKKRSAYDQFGHAGVGAGGFGGGGPGGFGGDGAFSDIFGDVFGDIFGGRGGGGRRGNRGSDLRYDLTLTLEDAVAGKEVKIRIPTAVECQFCGGTGPARHQAQDLSNLRRGRSGTDAAGLLLHPADLPPMPGQWTRIIEEACSHCRGAGRVQEHKTLSVKVPAGVDTGDRIRLAGEGERGPHGGPAGDLYVQVQVQEHPIFTREDSNLFCEVPIGFVEVALGGELEVPTLEGKGVLKIPAGTQTGKMFRIRGKGVRPVRGGPVGDLICRVVIETPVNLTERQKDLLREFDDSVREGGERHSPNSSSWLDGVKSFFEKMGF